MNKKNKGASLTVKKLLSVLIRVIAFYNHLINSVHHETKENLEYYYYYCLVSQKNYKKLKWNFHLCKSGLPCSSVHSDQLLITKAPAIQNRWLTSRNHSRAPWMRKAKCFQIDHWTNCIITSFKVNIMEFLNDHLIGDLLHEY